MQALQVGGPSCVRVLLDLYNHPEVDRIWLLRGISYNSFEDHILSTPGWQ